MQKNSTIFLCIGAALLVAFMVFKAPSVAPVIDWNYDETEFLAKVEEVQNWLEIEKPAKPLRIWKYHIHGEAWAVRKQFGDHIANEMLKDGILAITYAQLPGGDGIGFDSRGYLCLSRFAAVNKQKSLSPDEALKQRLAFIKKFCAPSDETLESSNLQIPTRPTSYPGMQEWFGFGSEGNRIASFTVMYRPPHNKGESAENYPDYVGLPPVAWFGSALGIVGISALLFFLLFTVRLKTDHQMPLVPIFVVSLTCFFCVIGCYLLFDPNPGVNRISLFYWNTIRYSSAPFLLAGVLGYGWSIDQRVNQSRALSDACSALTGRLPPRNYVKHLGTGVLLAIWVLGLYTLIAWSAGKVFDTTFRPQPDSIFLDMLRSVHPVIAASLYFIFIAVTEEFLYRICGLFLIWRITGKKSLAISISAIVFAFAHLKYAFLAPEHPLIIKLICCFVIAVVWGIAMFRVGFLPVLISHFLVDVGLAVYLFKQIPQDLYWQGIGFSMIILLIPVVTWLVRRPFTNVKSHAPL